jgi:acyl dehydratase
MTLPSPFEIPPFIVPEVRMADVVTVMDVMQDLNPIHVDLVLAKELGLRGCVNQGPSNLAYVTNMFMAWAGSTAIRQLKLRFKSISCPGDRLESRGTVTSVESTENSTLAHCDFELVRTSGDDLPGDSEETIVRGSAIVKVTTSLAESMGYVPS